MASYRLRPAAQDDLEDIWDYTLREWGVDQALSYTDDLEAAIELICESPAMYRERDEYVPPVRISPHGEHLIIYEIEDGKISVTRILHSSMDVNFHLSGRN